MPRPSVVRCTCWKTADQLCPNLQRRGVCDLDRVCFVHSERRRLDGTLMHIIAAEEATWRKLTQSSLSISSHMIPRNVCSFASSVLQPQLHSRLADLTARSHPNAVISVSKMLPFYPCIAATMAVLIRYSTVPPAFDPRQRRHNALAASAKSCA